MFQEIKIASVATMCDQSRSGHTLATRWLPLMATLYAHAHSTSLHIETLTKGQQYDYDLFATPSAGPPVADASAWPRHTRQVPLSNPSLSLFSLASQVPLSLSSLSSPLSSLFLQDSVYL